MPSANTPSAEQDHFDLLPFIAVMMCLLGTLLLVTMSMAAINVGAGAGEGWVPEQDPGAKIPVLIEWDGRYATWHSDQGVRQIDVGITGYPLPFGARRRQANAPEPETLDNLLDNLEARKLTHYALFAVRPRGFWNFRRFESRFQSRGIETGAEPVEEGKPVHLILPSNPAPLAPPPTESR